MELADKFLTPSRSLVLFSGGKDSFITSCMEIEAGYKVILFSCNSGTIWGEENLQHGVRRLQNRYGENKVEFAGVCSTAGILQQLNKQWMYMDYRTLGEKYPNIIHAQLQCLFCQASMWVAALAYAKAKGIKRVVAGNRGSDVFCTGMRSWIIELQDLGKELEIQVEFPVWNKTEWDTKNGVSRDLEMVERLFEPQVLEPKCVVGRPVEKMHITERSDMKNFFSHEIVPYLKPLVEKMAQVYTYLKLSTVSLEALHYPAPTGEGGIF